VSQEGY